MLTNADGLSRMMVSTVKLKEEEGKNVVNDNVKLYYLSYNHIYFIRVHSLLYCFIIQACAPVVILEAYIYNALPCDCCYSSVGNVRLLVPIRFV